MQNNFVVIMAGGIGSRFWPLSRTHFPKQFQDIMGNGSTMIQQTLARFEGICPIENVFVVTNKDYKELVETQLPMLSPDQILLEPIARNTAPCVAYACHKIALKNPNANIVIAPADHLIDQPAQFEEIILHALDAVSKSDDILLTLGMHPSRPDTGYGYIQYIEAKGRIKKVKTFTEKPHYELACTFLESGDFVWNSGIFIWSAQAILRAIAKYLPELNDIFEELKPALYTENEKESIQKAYLQCKNISIDYGIMEKSDQVFVLPSDFGWSDVGTWKALYELCQKDSCQNVVEGNVMLYDVDNCIVKTSGKQLVVVAGLQNFIVAESDGVIMICPKDQEQRVKDFVTDAKSKKDKKFV